MRKRTYKRTTLAQFNEQHPGKEWTVKSLKVVQEGSRVCSRCGERKALIEFGFVLNGQRKKTVRSACRACRYYRVSTTENLEYTRKLREMDAEILADDLCDVCGKEGATHFWRNTSKGDFTNWLGLHKHCAHRAKKQGLISKGALIRPKSELGGDK